MIYLIDDNKYGQMSENYGIDYTQELGKYSDCVIWKCKMINEEIKGIINTASCILIHDSFDEDIKNEIVSLSKNEKIPYVIFSGSFTATVFEDNSIIKIKKDRMYYNLLPFIDNFRDKITIDLKLLNIGNPYNKIKAKIIKNRLFFSVLLDYRNFVYELAFIRGNEAYKDLKELVHLSNQNKEIETFFPEFEENLLNNNVNIIIMKNIIDELVKKVIENG